MAKQQKMTLTTKVLIGMGLGIVVGLFIKGTSKNPKDKPT